MSKKSKHILAALLAAAVHVRARIPQPLFSQPQRRKCLADGYLCGHGRSQCCEGLECMQVALNAGLLQVCMAEPINQARSQPGPNDWLGSFRLSHQLPNVGVNESLAWAQKCLRNTSSAGSADRLPTRQMPELKYKYKPPRRLHYPHDAEAHYRQVLKATAPFRKEGMHNYYVS